MFLFFIIIFFTVLSPDQSQELQELVDPCARFFEVSHTDFTVEDVGVVILVKIGIMMYWYVSVITVIITIIILKLYHVF